MEIADVLSCDFFDSQDWDGREKSRVHVYKQGEQVGLNIETERTGSDGRTQELTTIKVTRMDIKTLRQIQSGLGEWLQKATSEQIELTTRPVEGKYKDSSEELEIYRLRVEFTALGLRILPLASGNQPMPNAAHIPCTGEIHNEATENHSHLKRLYSLIEVFLAGIEQESDDVIQSTKYLMDPESHIHPDLKSVCLERLNSGDCTGVVQAAGTALENALESKAPTEIVSRSNNATDLVNQTFAGADPVFGWGYNSGEQQGLHYLYAGAFMALRNPTSHPRGDPDRNRYLDDIDVRDALDILCLFNFLLRRLDAYGTTTLEQEACD
ncbi:TIGR02391 family protein [Haloferax sp. Atlit-48N]|uniref:TIGR02391 family protein n=1 Tax=Haloferax sp. Atlit-48N TaxID=2077198 RepID=A0ACD5HZG6_9EURY|nr:TIGR02391 family protein [Haloferax sp. Atlit-48N]